MTNRELKREILLALSDLVEHCPDVRFGQLVANLSCIARGPTPEAVWDMEDDELLAATRSHNEDYQKRLGATGLIRVSRCCQLGDDVLAVGCVEPLVERRAEADVADVERLEETPKTGRPGLVAQDLAVRIHALPS